MGSVQKSVLRLVCITKGQSCFNQAIYLSISTSVRLCVNCTALVQYYSS
nr:MAG TPA: hypothetical protein [Caudoviricetes sp.]DAY19532.1 MAG TPA: hypothetical protein [Caudoviricetes sp.]